MPADTISMDALTQHVEGHGRQILGRLVQQIAGERPLDAWPDMPAAMGEEVRKARGKAMNALAFGGMNAKQPDILLPVDFVQGLLDRNIIRLKEGWLTEMFCHSHGLTRSAPDALSPARPDENAA